MTQDPVVWFAGVSWDGVRGTDRHLVTALARHTRVLWVDPPVSPLTPGRFTGGRRTVRPRLSRVDDRVERLTPLVLPGHTRPGVRATTWPLVRAQVRLGLRRLGARPRAVVASHLDDVLGGWGPGVRTVLFGTDDFVAGAELMGQPADRLRAEERRAVGRADVLVTITPELAARWAAMRPGVEPAVVPNGCDPDAYAGLDALPRPAGFDLPAPVVGLVGQLSDRIDLDVLEAVADAGLSLLLVGPHDGRWEAARLAALTARPGVHATGLVPAADLPRWLATIDVGLTPYRDTAFNRASFPLKTLEYLAAGRPVVSTDLPATRRLLAGAGDGVLTVATGPAGVVDALRRVAAGGRDPGLAARCRALADRHSWTRRAETFSAAVGLDVPVGPAVPEPLEVP